MFPVGLDYCADGMAWQMISLMIDAEVKRKESGNGLASELGKGLMPGLGANCQNSFKYSRISGHEVHWETGTHPGTAKNTQ